MKDGMSSRTWGLVPTIVEKTDGISGGKRISGWAVHGDACLFGGGGRNFSGKAFALLCEARSIPADGRDSWSRGGMPIALPQL
jgi:hypothetical protein